MQKRKQDKRIIVGSVAFLLVLSGCDFFKQKKDIRPVQTVQVQEDLQVLFSVDGKTVITAQQFENHLEKIIQTNPQVKEILESVPSMRYNIFSGMIGQELIRLWAEKTGIKDSAEYQKDLQQALKMVEFEIAQKYFVQEIQENLKVSDAEIKKYYEAHKTKVPDLVVSPGGVDAVAITFATQAEVQKFMRKYPDFAQQFDKCAQAEQKEVTHFTMINEYSVDIDKAVRQQLVAAKKAPSIVRVKGADEQFWVCLVTKKEEPEYRPLEEVKDGIEGALKNEKMQVAFGSKLEALKTAYQAQEDKQYFEKQKGAALLSQLEDTDTETISAKQQDSTARVA